MTTVGHDGYTPLTRDIQTKSLSRIKSRLEKGASMEHQDGHGNTALLAAVKSNHPKKVLFFIRQGANLDIKDNHGDTPS